MNAIFEVKENGTIGVLMLNDCNCGEIEEAQDEILETLENWLYENDLEDIMFSTFKDKLIYLDDTKDLSVMKLWDGFDGNSCGIYYNSKIYSLWCLTTIIDKEA